MDQPRNNNRDVTLISAFQGPARYECVKLLLPIILYYHHEGYTSDLRFPRCHITFHVLHYWDGPEKVASLCALKMISKVFHRSRNIFDDANSRRK